MGGIIITCDRQDGLWRVAVWQGKDLRDVYLDNADAPDLTGAVLGAKVARLKAGGQAAWCEDGQGRTIYVENPGAVRSGDAVALRIVTTARQGKAWKGVRVDAMVGSALGLLVAPPRPWERAIDDLVQHRIASLAFADPSDHAECLRWLETNRPELAPRLSRVKASPHPELDEILDRLQEPTVPLPGGGSIVIEETEALVAIDINGGETANALAVNLQAVKEIARQIRWRNLSGIIVIDALKVGHRTDKAKILNALTRAVADDPRLPNVFGMTKLGLIEMTRARRWASVGEILSMKR